MDRETGARRPFGFVEFETEAEADSAVAATRHSIAGRDVSILPLFAVLHSIDLSHTLCCGHYCHELILLVMHPRDDSIVVNWSYMMTV